MASPTHLDYAFERLAAAHLLPVAVSAGRRATGLLRAARAAEPRAPRSKPRRGSTGGVPALVVARRWRRNRTSMTCRGTTPNYAALTPLRFLERGALIHPARAFVVHGPVQYTWADTYSF